MLKPDIPNDALTRIIVADDGGVEHLSFCSRLGDHRNFAVRNASDWPGLKVLLDDRRQDVVIIGVSVGGMSGIEINSKIKSFSADPPATIMLDAAGNVHAAIKAFRCGFTDYLIKGSTGDRALYEAILRASRIVRAERAKAENLRYLEWLAQRDGLTGLPNRHCLDERLEQLLQIGVRHNAPFAAVLIRFNEYEYVNSAFGYKIGDQALHAFANKLKSAMRKSDTVGRLDRDTFLYLVDRDVTEQGIKGVCARLAEAAKFSLELDTLSLTLTASVAAAVFPNNGTAVAELLDAAERALPPASGGPARSLRRHHRMLRPRPAVRQALPRRQGSKPMQRARLLRRFRPPSRRIRTAATSVPVWTISSHGRIPFRRRTRVRTGRASRCSRRKIGRMPLLRVSSREPRIAGSTVDSACSNADPLSSTTAFARSIA